MKNLSSIRLIYLCNAIDEVTCNERGITSDSPAATKKVFEISKALRKAGVRVLVLSLGRGRQSGNGIRHVAKVKRVDGVPVLYASFLNRPLLTYLWTMLSISALIWRLRLKPCQPALLAYNRLILYWPAMELARLLRFRLFLDLEDGDVRHVGIRWKSWLARFMKSRFDGLCQSGAMLATSALEQQYAGSRFITCYGVSDEKPGQAKDFSGSKELVIHLGGTLQPDTGAELLLQSIHFLRDLPNPPPLRFVVTGVGESAESLNSLSKEAGLPKVEFLGRVSRTQYLEVLGEAHVGLALKLQSGQLGDTTFPSKVIEIASKGMLLVSTCISDVPALFGKDGAIYVQEEKPQELADLFLRISRERHLLARTASLGTQRVREQCSEESVGQSLKEFFLADLSVVSRDAGTGGSL